MKLSSAIKNTLSSDEQVKKTFSFGNRHVYFRFVFSCLKWLLIAAAASLLIVFLYKVGNLATTSGFWPLAEASNPLTGQKFSDNFVAIFVFIGLFIFLVFFLPVILFYHFYFLRIANTFVFTDRRIIVKRGWLNTNVKSVDFDRITDVSVDQSFFDKIVYASGTLSVSTAGGDGYEIVLNCVDDPHSLKKTLFDLKEEYRKKYYPNSQNQTLPENMKP